MTATLNSTYDQQSNIVFSCGSYDSPTLNADYGSSIQMGGAQSELAAFPPLCSGSPDAFFVWELELWNDWFYADVSGLNLGGMIWIDDDRSPTDDTLSHEMGHYLGLTPPIDADYGGLFERANELMNKWTPPNGYKILHSQVDIMNP